MKCITDLNAVARSISTGTRIADIGIRIEIKKVGIRTKSDAERGVLSFQILILMCNLMCNQTGKGPTDLVVGMRTNATEGTRSISFASLIGINPAEISHLLMFGTLSIYVSVNDPLRVWVVLMSQLSRQIVPLTCCMHGVCITHHVCIIHYVVCFKPLIPGCIQGTLKKFLQRHWADDAADLSECLWLTTHAPSRARQQS